jgi:metal-responsive CopG/Arc/MetJ family transcriptional regulator
MAYKKSQSAVAGISFRPEVLEFVDEVAEQEGRTRSNFINQLVREHAARIGVDIPTSPIRQGRKPREEEQMA